MGKFESGVLLAGLVGFAGGAFAAWQYLPEKTETPGSPKASVAFNQQVLEEIRSDDLDLRDPREVFAFVFAQLPERVIVYPSENYYYFSFYKNGQLINGNLRLDAADRAQGQLNFGYFGTHNLPEEQDDLSYLSEYIELNQEQGVDLREISSLAYEVTYQGKSVVFELFDLSQTPPRDLALREGEKFMARMLDESGWQFLLIFDESWPQFRFVLDEMETQPDVLEELTIGIWAGRLTGFVFYEDDLGRKILFGVDEKNIRRNNHFDGPFDQLADNFVEGETLRDAMQAAYPYTRGQIDARGVFLDDNGERGESRLAITPYHAYSSLAEIKQFAAACRAQNVEPIITRCLTYDYKQSANAAR